MPFLFAVVVLGLIWYFRPDNVKAAAAAPPGTVSGEVPIVGGGAGSGNSETQDLDAWRAQMGTWPLVVGTGTVVGRNLLDGDVTPIQSP